MRKCPMEDLVIDRKNMKMDLIKTESGCGK
jgi:hypothetical protein